MGLKDIECAPVDEIDLAQDRDRAVVNREVNRGVS